MEYIFIVEWNEFNVPTELQKFGHSGLLYLVREGSDLLYIV